MISAIHDGMDATSPARRSSGIDFECGAQSSLPFGTFCSARRVRGTSRSSWSRNSWVSFMLSLRKKKSPAYTHEETLASLSRLDSAPRDCGGGLDCPCRPPQCPSRIDPVRMELQHLVVKLL